MLIFILLLNILIWVITINQLLKGIFSLPGSLLLRIIFSIYLTLTLFSFLYFISLSVSLSILAFLAGIFIISMILISFTWKKLIKTTFRPGAGKSSSVHVALILLGILVITGIFINVAQGYKYGDWDGWALWNLHAKFLASGSLFSRLFSSGLGWTHPDYPLMLPSWIAIFWRCSGNCSPIIPTVVAYVVLISIALSVFASLHIQKQTVVGILFLFIFPLDHIFVARSSTQYADTLMGLFILLSMILFNHRNTEDKKLYYLLGFFTASSAWIKNEGILFFLVFSIYFIFSSWRNRSAITRYFTGALLPLLVILLFKTGYAPVNDLVQAQTGNTFLRVFDIHRSVQIGQFYSSLLFRDFPVIILLIVTAFIVDRKYFLTWNSIILMTMQVGFLSVFLFTASDLTWGLNTACDRLTHQLYPALIYTIICYFSARIISSFSHPSG
jgi:hypothetical protein